MNVSPILITPAMKKQKMHSSETLSNGDEVNNIVSANIIGVNNNYSDANLTVSNANQNVSFSRSFLECSQTGEQQLHFLYISDAM